MVKKRERSPCKSPPQNEVIKEREKRESPHKIFFLDEDDELLEYEEPQSNLRLIRFIVFFAIGAALLLGFLILMDKLWIRP